MLKLKLQYFGHLMWRANSLEKTLMLGKVDGKKKSRQLKMEWLDSIIDSTDMNLSKLQERVEDREAWWAAVQRVAKSWTWPRDGTTETVRLKIFSLFFVCFFMYYLCEMYYKPITVQSYIDNGVIWVPRLTLLDLRTHFQDRIHSYVRNLL